MVDADGVRAAADRPSMGVARRATKGCWARKGDAPVTTEGPSASGHDSQPGERDRVRLAIWALAIAATGTPATMIVLIFGQGKAAATGAGVIGTMTLAAFAAARTFGRVCRMDDARPQGRSLEPSGNAARDNRSVGRVTADGVVDF